METILDEKRLTPSQWVKLCERKADNLRYAIENQRRHLKELRGAATVYRKHRHDYRKYLASGHWMVESAHEKMLEVHEVLIHKPYYKESIRRCMSEIQAAHGMWIELLKIYQATVKPKPVKVERTKLQQRFDKLHAGYIRECKRAKLAITQTIENGYIIFTHAHGTFQLKQVA